MSTIHHFSSVSPTFSNPLPMQLIGPPQGDGVSFLEQNMQKLQILFDDFMSAYQTLYLEWEQGEITGPEFSRSLTPSTLPFNQFYLSLKESEGFSILISQYPSLGVYSGLSSGFVADLDAILSFVSCAPLNPEYPGSAPPPEQLANDFEQIDTNFKVWVKTGIYKATYTSSELSFKKLI